MIMSFGSKDQGNTSVTERSMANAIRALTMDAVHKAGNGHPGMPMGMADVAAVLYNRFMNFDPSAPEWTNRDRFILSAGHGSMLIYSLLYLTGYPGMDIEQIKNFRQLGSKTAGHPEYGHAPGIETTTGPLGQGIATAVGMALGERLLNQRYGNDICDHYTYVMAGDGCLMEGISHEAISFAGHLKLSKLIVLFDDNSISIDGSTDLSVSDDQLKRFEASGWDTTRVDGHDPEAVAAAIEAAQKTGAPSLIACKTIIGFGAPNKQGTSATHGADLGAEEIAETRKALDWSHAPFEIPEEILAAWRSTGERGKAAHGAWKESASRLSSQELAGLTDPVTEGVKAAMATAINGIKAKFAGDAPKIATRVSSKEVLEVLIPAVPGLLGGSADLTGSVGTKTSHHAPVKTGDFSGNYIHYGVREHGMAAAMNGLAQHGGVVPYAGTFLVFSDYCRPSIRLSALMEQRVVYVMTHDSIGLGEDGPTHQPVEHVASLRAIPNLHVFRPADAIECAECWELAINTPKTPSVMVLTRQGVPTFQRNDLATNSSAKGAYVLREPEGGRDVTILATGSEVEIAVAASEALAQEGIKAAVVSMPCWELFDAQSKDYQDQVLGTAPRIAIEAAVSLGWDKWTGSDGMFVGMKSFGASAPAEQLYKHFGITSEALVQGAHTLINARKG